MKNSIRPLLKTISSSRIWIAFLLLLFFFPAKAQTSCDKGAYEIINAVFDSGETKLYHTALFGKGWAHYFEDYDEILKNVGIPTLISDDELKQIIGEEELGKIHSAIYALGPCRFSSEQLNDNISLAAEFDTEEAISQGVFRISMPVIVEENLAVLKKESPSESAVFILQKKEGKWTVIYTFYDWLVL